MSFYKLAKEMLKINSSNKEDKMDASQNMGDENNEMQAFSQQTNAHESESESTQQSNDGNFSDEKQQSTSPNMSGESNEMLDFAQQDSTHESRSEPTKQSNGENFFDEKQQSTSPNMGSGINEGQGFPQQAGTHDSESESTQQNNGGNFSDEKQQSTSQNMGDDEDEIQITTWGEGETVTQQGTTPNIDDEYITSKKSIKRPEVKTIPTRIDNTFQELDLSPHSSGFGNSNELKLNELIDSTKYDYHPVIKLLIQQFLSTQFVSHESNLNVRGRSSYKKENGWAHWLTKDLAIHLKTNQLTKLEYDKYNFQYGSGESDPIPLSIFFDLSPSMEAYADLQATIAVELLRNGVSVILGANSNLYCQFNKMDDSFTVSDMTKIILEQKTTNKVEMVDINGKLLGDYLIDQNAEKCIIFSDFDPLHEIIKLSHHCDVYFFNFRKLSEECKLQDILSDYEGIIYNVQNADDIKEALIELKNYSFDTIIKEQKRKIRRK